MPKNLYGKIRKFFTAIYTSEHIGRGREPYTYLKIPYFLYLMHIL